MDDDNVLPPEPAPAPEPEFPAEPAPAATAPSSGLSRRFVIGLAGASMVVAVGAGAVGASLARPDDRATTRDIIRHASDDGGPQGDVTSNQLPTPPRGGYGGFGGSVGSDQATGQTGSSHTQSGGS